MSMSDETNNAASAGKCPFHRGGVDHSAGAGTGSKEWWPKQLRIDLLNQHSSRSNPLGEDFDYRKEFSKLDYSALKGDLKSTVNRLTTVVACRLGQLCGPVYPYGGTVRVPIAPLTVAAAPDAVSNALHR